MGSVLSGGALGRDEARGERGAGPQADLLDGLIMPRRLGATLSDASAHLCLYRWSPQSNGSAHHLTIDPTSSDSPTTTSTTPTTAAGWSLMATNDAPLRWGVLNELRLDEEDALRLVTQRLEYDPQPRDDKQRAGPLAGLKVVENSVSEGQGEGEGEGLTLLHIAVRYNRKRTCPRENVCALYTLSITHICTCAHARPLHPSATCHFGRSSMVSIQRRSKKTVSASPLRWCVG
jgi:hypothetical protein